ncbi:MAG: hypothetical protein HY648_06785 [Acidobacteria bacterium]|nr:hypothetical protein [Acidobacteriota bacterium]
MTELTPTRDWIAMKENIQKAISSLEVCWKCQQVSECQKYVLGNLVMVWLCNGCLADLERPRLDRRIANRPAVRRKTKTPDLLS